MSSDNLYQNIIEQCKSIIIVVNKDLTVKTASKYAIDFLGYKTKIPNNEKLTAYIFKDKKSKSEFKKAIFEITKNSSKTHEFISKSELKSGQKVDISWKINALNNDPEQGFIFTGEKVPQKNLPPDEGNVFKSMDFHRKLVTAVRQSPAIIVITDNNGRIEYVNPEFTRITGYSKEEAIGKKPSILKSGVHGEEYYKNLWETVSSGEIWKGEFYNKKKNGAFNWERASISPIFDEHGKITHYVKVSEDFTLEKEQETDLKVSQMRYRSIFENSLTGIFYINTKGEILEINPKMLEILGSPSLEATKQINVFTFESLVAIGYSEDLKKCIQTGEVIHGEKHYKSKWGKLIYARYYFNPIKRNDEVVGVLANVEDITEQVDARDIVKQSRERFKKLSALTIESIIIHKNGIAIDANLATSRMMGYELNEIIGKNVIEMLVAEEHRYILIKGAKEHRQEPYHINAVKKDGTVFPVEIEVRDIEWKGEQVRVAAIRDLTDKIKADKQLKESEERFKKLAELTFEGIIIHKNGIIVDANMSFCKLSGYDNDEIIDKNAIELFIPEKHHNLVKKRLQQGITEPIELEGKTKSGKLLPVELVTKEIFYKGEQVRVAAIRDISIRKEYEKKLIENEKYLNTILNSFIDGIYVISPEYKIQYLNKAMQEKIGENALGENCHKTIFKNEDICEWCVYNKLTPENRIMSYDLYVKEKDEYKNIRNVLLENGSILSIYYDITVRKKAEIELHESRERFELSVNGSNDGIWDWHIFTNELYLSPKWKAQVGYKDNELANEFKTFEKLLHPDDKPFIMNYVDKYLKGEIKEFNVEFRLKHKQGHYIWINGRGEALRDENGIPYRMAGSHTDITTRKSEEIALQESEERFKKLSELTFEGIILHKNGFVIDVNASFCRITGYALKEIIGENIVQTAILDKYHKDIKKNMSKEHAEPYHVELKRKDGKIITVELEARNIMWQGEQIRFAAVRDLTERKKAQAALKESEANLKRAQQIAHMGSWVYYNKTDKLEWSDEMFYLLGLKPEDYVNPSFELYLSRYCKDNLAEAKEFFDNIITNNISPFTFEYRTVSFHGEHRVIRTEGIIELDENGENEKIIGTDLDITEMKKAEEQLALAAKKSEQANKYKSEFLANMSHELRTPLVGILGFNELMLEDENLNEDQIENLTMVQKSGRKLLEILTDILELSTIEAGKITINKSMCSLENLVRDIKPIYSIRLKEKDVDLSFELNKIDTIYTDPSRLTQVLLNLIGNAIKFTHQGTIKVNVKRKDNGLLFFVADTGIGIKEELKDKIFNSFIMGETGYTKKYSGTGLGLAICKRIVNMLGGKIWVESEFGKGSTFYFYLPNFLRKKETESAEKTVKNNLPENNEDQKSLKLCVIDDEKMILTYIEKFIQTKTKHTVTTFNSSKKFAEILKTPEKLNCNLILMDINMPDINGVELLNQIKEVKKDTIVVAFTAYAMKTDREKFLNMGFDDYLAKPVRNKILIDFLNKYS